MSRTDTWIGPPQRISRGVANLETGILSHDIRLTRTPVAVVSPYALSADDVGGPHDSALNWYTRKLTQSLHLQGCEVTVISSSGDQSQPWTDDGVRIVPTFVRGKLNAAAKIFFGAFRSRARVVHFQHELFAYGGIFTAFTIPLCVGMLRFVRRRIVTTVHGVIPLDKIDRDFVHSNRVGGGAAPPAFVRFVWKALVRMVCGFSDVVQVHEEQHRLNLVRQYGVRTPIIVIPIGIDVENSSPVKVNARRALALGSDDEVLLFFGYFASYKGLGELIAAMALAFDRRPKLKIILAGDVSSRLKKHNGTDQILRKHNVDSNRVVRLGFVPESMVSTVFSAADVLILPYTMSMSSSGPMSIGLSYKIPILLSSAFHDALPSFPGMFRPVPQEIASAVCRFFDDKSLRQAIEQRCNVLRNERAWPNVAHRVHAMYSSVLRPNYQKALTQ